MGKLYVERQDMPRSVRAASALTLLLATPWLLIVLCSALITLTLSAPSAGIWCTKR